jgi:lipopolysaccharide cholinephosphotransferase
MDLKVRDRTPEELSVRKYEFLKICDILDNLNINYFLQTGILLGAIRDKDLIKWDWDIEISVFSKEFLNQIEPLAESLKKAGFKILNITKKENDSKIDFIGKYPEEVTGYTVFSWNYSRIKDNYWRREFSVPSKFLNNLSTINFFGRKFKCPHEPEQYLTFAYGNWKKPLRTSDKELYNSRDFKNKRISFLRDMRSKIKKIIYLILKGVRI